MLAKPDLKKIAEAVYKALSPRPRATIISIYVSESVLDDIRAEVKRHLAALPSKTAKKEVA